MEKEADKDVKMIVTKPLERFYLQKDKNQDVFVDLRKPVPQHQLDGVRFIYKQYKKKSPGVILNDPQGYGKCLQTVLFLKALRPTLKKPILILTQSLSVWKEIFEEWTDCSWEVTTRESQPFSESHFIFINPVEDGSNFTRREWSIVVLHNSDHIDNTKEFLRLKFNVQYQIWISSADMKENLHNLASVYEWLHPKQKFNIESFTSTKNDWKDRVKKMIFLDAFLEDVLLRRSDFANLLAKEFELPNPTPEIKQSRKNKDPTGTKVKRTKRRRIDDEDDNATPLKDGIDHHNKATNVKTNEMIMEDFIAKDYPVLPGENDLYRNGNSSSTITRNTDLNFSNIFNKMSKENYNNSKEEMLVEDENNDFCKALTTEQSNDKNVMESEENSLMLNFHYSETQNMSTDSMADGKEKEQTQNSTTIAETNDIQMCENATMKLESEIATKEKECEEINYTKDNSKDIIENDKDRQDNMNCKLNEMKDKIGNQDELDAKLAEMEEKALKRFKGSFLDRLF